MIIGIALVAACVAIATSPDAIDYTSVPWQAPNTWRCFRKKDRLSAGFFARRRGESSNGSFENACNFLFCLT